MVLVVAGEAVVRFSIDDVGAVVGQAQDAEEGEVAQGGVREVEVRIRLVKVRGGKTPARDGITSQRWRIFSGCSC